MHGMAMLSALVSDSWLERPGSGSPTSKWLKERIVNMGGGILTHSLFSSSFPIQLFKLSSKRHICSLPHHNPSVLEWANRTSSQSHTHPLTWIPEFRFKMESIRFFYWLLGTGYWFLAFRQVPQSEGFPLHPTLCTVQASAWTRPITDPTQPYPQRYHSNKDG